jgi:hypothetical protein
MRPGVHNPFIAKAAAAGRDRKTPQPNPPATVEAIESRRLRDNIVAAQLNLPTGGPLDVAMIMCVVTAGRQSRNNKQTN